MKHLLKIILLLLSGFSYAQNLLYNHADKKQADSLLLALPQSGNDTLKILMYSEVANYFVERNNTVANF